MEIQYLGGAGEVGRSCIVVHGQYDSTMLDCGIKVKGTTKEEQYPAIEKLKNSKRFKRLIITHAHMDHSGAAPYLVKNYPGIRIYTTQPTAHIMNVLLQDNIRIASQKEEDIPNYEQKDLDAMLNLINKVEYGDVNFVGRNHAMFIQAGHIIGASAILLYIDGKNILYTGDFTNTESSLIKTQEFERVILSRRIKIDLMISESTYGLSKHNAADSEYGKLRNDIIKTIKGGGKILIPAFALGRAQEILMRLKEDTEICAPIYVDGMIRTVNCIYGDNYKFLKSKCQRMALDNPNIFESENIFDVYSAKHRNQILKSNEPCIILSSSGMLSGGPSVIYAKELMGDEHNLIAIVGYQDEDSPGYSLLQSMNNDDQYVVLDEERFHVRCQIRKYDFSGHAGRDEIIKTVKAINPKQLHLVHGDPDASESIMRDPELAGIKNITIPRIGDIYTIE